MIPGAETLSSKYEGFSNLVTSLENRITKDLVSNELQHDLKEAREELQEVRHNYLQVLTVYTCMNEILMENNYGMKDSKFEDNSTEQSKNIFQVVAEEASSASCRHCLNLSYSNNSSNDPSNQLFGFSQDDFVRDNRDKKKIHQKVHQSFLPLMEEKLQKKALKVFKYWNPSSQDSEGLMLAKANQLSILIEKEKEKLERLKRKLSSEDGKTDSLYDGSNMKLQSNLAKLESIKQQTNDKQVDDLTSVTAAWLETKCDYILAKIKVMKNHLFKETYTKENLEALKQIRHHLEDEIVKTKKDLKQARYSISSYEAIGDTFKQLLCDYAELTTQIDNKKWALHELQSSK